MKLNLQDWPKVLKLWAPPLIGIPVMFLLASLFDVARYFLFMHHLFWMFGIILLVNPVGETLSPSAHREMRGRPSPRPSAKARVRAEAHESTAKPKPWPASETAAERLARLQRNKNTLDHRIEKLAKKEKENSR